MELAAPVSGEVLLPGPGTELVAIGGVTSDGSLGSGIFTFDTSTGTLTHVANLAVPLEDASGAVIAGQDVVFGGRSPAALAVVQGLPAPGSAAAPASSANAVTLATELGALPQPRADSQCATIGATTYLVGGDNGTSTVPQVVATTDGRNFDTVVSLSEPVESGSVAALGGKLYVFGGRTTTATGPSAPVDTIQMVDPASHRARVVGHLPEPLSEAAAVTLGNHLLVIGGVTTQSHPGQRPSHTSDPNPSTTGGSSAVTVSSIWSFDPTTGKVSQAGQLAEPVSQAGVAVTGSEVWVVGGQSNGEPVPVVQVIKLRTN
jgi:N-acetylneuraminic acid mutarotase